MWYGVADARRPWSSLAIPLFKAFDVGANILATNKTTTGR